MATMSQTGTIFTVVTVLALQLCTGEKSCVIWSSARPVVQLGSSFQVFCTFNCKCKGSMYSGHPPTRQRHSEVNSTTIFFKVQNITKNRTFSCQCICLRTLADPCGLDISAGYLPEQPKNISCTYKVTNNETGDVLCTWNRGRDTYLRDSSVLCVRTLPGNHTDGLETCRDSSKGTASPSASFSVSSSVEQISVWVRAKNQLGSAVSVTINYTLSDIAMPQTPVLGQPECSSRECVIKVELSVRTQHLEIQYRSEAQTWTSCPDSGAQMSLVQVWTASSLQPYRLYHFRARSRFSSGLWSQWSTTVSSWTQEEAPARELDVWYASDLKSLRVYWKEANISITRGKIIEYKVKVYSPNSSVIRNLSADARNYSTQHCANCEVTVWAFNSKGSSPPARITTNQSKASPPQDVQVTADNHSVAISWRKPESARVHVTYVVEWYPEGRKLDELRWVRLGRDERERVVITGIKPFECYEGAVNVVYKDSSASRTGFIGVTTGKSVPAAGPSFAETVVGNEVKVTWTEIPRADRRGCITKYTIYLEDSSRQIKLYSVLASERTYIIKDLSLAAYSVWMTASNTEGEGPASQKLKIFIQQETQLSVILVCVVFPPIMFLLCVCQSSAVKRRFCVFFQCLLLEVPDPANSKWAKECTKEKGKMNLQLQLSNSTVTEGEEEPILVDVEELPQQSSDTQTPADITPHLHPQTSLSPSMEPVTPLYPPTTYIKSFSHDSDSSDHTQTSMDTNTTAYYISSHGLGTMDEEDFQEDEGEDGEFVNKLGFFPSHNIFTEPLDFGGQLTLDAVKINCNDFF